MAGRVWMGTAQEGLYSWSGGRLARFSDPSLTNNYISRKHGHGFGLHSAALAAKEMGGKLVARSDGPGRGAEFTLELPTQPPGAGEQPVGIAHQPLQEAMG